jgi:hypothetical protein
MPDCVESINQCQSAVSSLAFGVGMFYGAANYFLHVHAVSTPHAFRRCPLQNRQLHRDISAPVVVPKRCLVILDIVISEQG